jgi:ribosome biogenesis GTPase
MKRYDVEHDESGWRALLSPEEYRVLREAGTEAPFSGAYVDTADEGAYRCRACGNPLFRSEAKYHSGCGWPSFTEPVSADAVEELPDTTHGTTRTEIRCGACGSHLGHVFTDGPGPSGLRYCMNSVSLHFEPAADPLVALGYTARHAALAAEYDSALVPGRVFRADRGFVFAATASGIVVAKPSTRLIKSADDGGLPVAGDWILLGGDESEPLAEYVLPRTTAIMRRDPGRAARVQVLAANVDTVFVTHPLFEAPNLPRIERELALVWESGARPVVVLTKADLSEDAASAQETVMEAAPGVTVHITSAATGQGIEEIRAYLEGGDTIVLIGPSGSGKSTLVNALAGEDIQDTREVRVSDGRGRHTTVSRELIQLPGGGLVIDTPGLRAVGMWESTEGIDQAFSDVASLAENCRFRDCRHDGEPGCAVEAAVAAGEITARRLESYRELQSEARHVTEQLDVRARLDRKREDKQLAKTIKRFYSTGKRGQGG